jgi:hypothetical protein
MQQGFRMAKRLKCSKDHKLKTCEIKGLSNRSELVLTVQYENAACAGGLTFLTEITDIKITQI